MNAKIYAFEKSARIGMRTIERNDEIAKCESVKMRENERDQPSDDMHNDSI